ncbi:MAG: hypothetical protein NTV34_09050 [Proteobacteria bacterium]|nr:hypothetical protein [Pseudomonadota bacterium]
MRILLILFVLTISTSFSGVDVVAATTEVVAPKTDDLDEKCLSDCDAAEKTCNKSCKKDDNNCWKKCEEVADNCRLECQKIKPDEALRRDPSLTTPSQISQPPQSLDLGGPE